jgi:hypothetical protein
LDIWVSIADKDRPALERALVAWASKHPLHTNRDWVPPLSLGPKLQIAFPEDDRVAYLGRSGGVLYISIADRIDVLTSLEGMNFEECFERPVIHEVEGVTVRAMPAADLDQAAEFRFASEGRH